ncbi:phage tail tube protein [uncultured Planococcus sp.]|uniref:phage tail tube protein n=1 Tax=uncultured Planococcus sp. TaxID=337815 RepID=UPI00262DF99B|nr:phage tail tube protein [uncultured Planococcus sp.]
MLDSKTIVNGTFCKVYHDGQWLFNVTSAEVSVAISKEEVARAGTRWLGDKVTTLKGEGSFSGYRVNNDLLSLVGQVQRGEGTWAPFVTELVMEVNDPESPQAKTFITLQNVSFDNIALLNFEVGSLVEEEWNFTFSGYSRK